MRLTLTVLISAVMCLQASAGEPWRDSFWLAGGGHWAQRQLVTITADASSGAEATPIVLTVGDGEGQLNVAGQRCAAVRICDQAGQELLFDVRSPGGATRHDGQFAAGDRLTFIATCPSGESVTYAIYSDNPDAEPVVDFLTTQMFSNGGFESGADGLPHAWHSTGSDARHHVDWSSDTKRSGQYSGHVAVDDGAEPSWVQWRQSEVPVRPGGRYVVTGYVKTQNMNGHAGLYIHVHGDGEVILNKSSTIKDPAGDWQQVRLAFTAPEGSTLMAIGTILRGTGEAWYDDVTLEAIDEPTGLSVKLAAVERRDVKRQTVDKSKWVDAAEDWPFRATAPLVNHDAQAQAGVLVRMRIGQMVNMAGQPNQYAMRLITPGGDDVPLMIADETAIGTVDIPAATRLDAAVYLSPKHRAGSITEAYQRLLNSPANLARGHEGWKPNVPVSAAFKTAEGVKGPVTEHGLRMSIPADKAGNWRGFTRMVKPVKPNRTYLYAAWIKTTDATSGVHLHAHMYTGEGKLCEWTPFRSVGNGLEDDNDWTLVSGMMLTPSDCQQVSLHLTNSGAGTIEYDGVLFAEVVETPLKELTYHRSLDQSQPGELALWQPPTIMKVFPQTPPSAEGRPDALRLSAARNEYENAQVAFRARRPIENFTIKVGKLRDDQDRTLPGVTVQRVGYVPVDYPTAYYQSEAPSWYRMRPNREPRCDGWAGLWPDPLIPAEPVKLEAERTESYYLTVHVPADATPGQYRGAVTITGKDFKAIDLPLEVTVRPFELPKRNRLRVIFDYRSGRGWNVHNTREQMNQWYRLLAKYRISPGMIYPEPRFVKRDGKIEMDTSGYDESARLLFDELDCSVAYTPHFFYSFGWAREPRRLFGHEAFSPAYKQAYRDTYGQFVEYAKQRGWLDRYICYLSDEPHDHAEGIAQQLADACDLARSVTDDIPVYSSTWHHIPEVDGHLTLWGVGQYGIFPVDKMVERQKAGEKLLITTDGQQCLDTPLLATERLLPYYCNKYGMTGYEFWGVSWWTLNPWQYGWHSYIRQSSDGKTYRSVRYPNGDGYLAYPGDDIGHDGPVPSIRLEAVRDGVEDYHYLALLRDLLAKAEGDSAAVKAARAALADAESLVTIPNAGGRYSTKILPEPMKLVSLRIRIAEAIEKLMAESK
ncbi:DUF4091 domain-containing protein [Planctomycetales bacterium ZRK34]|nr:DUF4091 domain-containing protein [Planctomycetales bacterium ZRK34]